MQKLARADSACKPWRYPDAGPVPPSNHRALNPATRSLPEIIQCTAILREMLGHAAAQAQRHPEQRTTLQAAAVTAADVAREAGSGLAPGQIRMGAGVSLPGGTP
jgi:hypothetical protein